MLKDFQTCRSDLEITVRPLTRAPKILSLALLGLLVLLFNIVSQDPVYAQTNLANISGTITDQAGATVPNCTVTVTNKATSAVRSITTAANGFYSFPSLPLGPYAIKASTPGFRAAVTTVQLTLNGVTADLSLTVGSATETVTVSSASESVALQTENATVDQSFSEEQLQRLPNTAGLSVLGIAVQGPAAQAGTDEPDNGDSGFFGQVSNSVNIAGLGIAHTQFLQDGVENVNLLTETANIVAPTESAAAVTTNLNDSPARFGEPAVINVITKSGSNSFHGAAYEYLQNDAFNSTNWYATSKPQLRYNNFGANLGGPVLKNKLFAFFNYTGFRKHSAYVDRERVPTSAELQGDFSNNNVSTTIYDPKSYSATGTSTAFANNKIPAGRLDNFGQMWLKLFPAANHPLGADNINYVSNVLEPNNADQYITRVDWNVKSNNQLMGTFFHAKDANGGNTFIPGLFGIFITTVGTNAALQDSWVLNQHLVNVLKIGFNRGSVLRQQQGAGAKNYAQAFGLVNLDAAPQQWAPPAISINNYNGVGDPWSPQGGLQNRYQYADELNCALGKHNVAIGGQFVRTEFFGNWVVANNGTYGYDGSATSQYVNGQRSQTQIGNALADLELGYPQNGTAGIGTSVGWFKESQVAAYVQDDWKLLQRLTVNLGIRYDFDNPPVTPKGGLYNIATNTVVPGTWKTNYNDWGPRIGFTWNALNKTVVRAGYGIYYTPIMYNNIQFELLYAPNFYYLGQTINIANPTTIENMFAPPYSGTTGYTMSKTLKDQSAQEWNLNIERSLTDNMLLTVAYLGNVTRHMSTRADGNQPYALSPGNTTGILDVRPQPLNGAMSEQWNAYNANYNALTASLQRRYAAGLQFLLAYTWSKAMDIQDADNNGIEDIYNPHLTWGLASFDRTNNVQLSGIYDLPFGPGRRFLNQDGLLNKEILGGWSLSFIQQLASGQPVSVSANNTSDTSGNHQSYAIETCNPKTGFTRTRFQILNPACFAQPAPGHYGTTRTIPVRQPGLYATNLSLFKAFTIYHDNQLVFRADAYSVLNHPEFGGGGGSAGSSTLGQLNYEASGQRSMQLSLKYQF
ncbi:MAG: TonB-dependent receptor [Terracidiphilus sp.]|nr:TonB-dependent receptor [Terracidiphilus sp.]